MLKIIETFSGIGSQVQSLKNIGVEYEILGTVEWDINAICAYDVIHHSEFDLSKYEEMDKNFIVEHLSQFTLSSNGKNPMSTKGLKMYSETALKRILLSIERNRNLVDINQVKGTDYPDDIDVLTYSFPCQDLSVCGFWHGNTSGIKKCEVNRSGLLWQIERILTERANAAMKMPKVLLMENVSNILSKYHIDDFNIWKAYLKDLGYHNHVYVLSARDFGIPQTRERVFMISFMVDENRHHEVEEYFRENNLEEIRQDDATRKTGNLSDFLRNDYSQAKYLQEALASRPNFTESRKKIFEKSITIFDGKKVIVDSIKTLTTKQDRYPNSGLIICDNEVDGKAPYRNLTARECMLLMGFYEEHYEKLVMNNFNSRKGRLFFTDSKIIKMSGNSIVVNVLESIFHQIVEILDLFGDSNANPSDSRSHSTMIEFGDMVDNTRMVAK